MTQDLDVAPVELTSLAEITFHVTPDDWLPIEKLITMFHPENSQVRWEPEKEAIARSLLQYGYTSEPVTVNRWNNKLVGGHGRTEVCYENGYRGNLPVVYLDLPSEAEHRRAMIRFNLARGHQDPQREHDEIEHLIKEYGRDTVQKDMGYLDEELGGILQQANIEEVVAKEKSDKPNPRKLPVDVIFPWHKRGGACCIAIRAGLKYAIRSGPDYADHLCPRSSGRHVVALVGCHPYAFDSTVHLAAVTQLTPKYATVCDAFSEQQCEALGLEYYPLEQILEWAEELEPYAQNVIICPRYDCIDRIPSRYMIGYASVPTPRPLCFIWTACGIGVCICSVPRGSFKSGLCPN